MYISDVDSIKRLAPITKIAVRKILAQMKRSFLELKQHIMCPCFMHMKVFLRSSHHLRFVSRAPKQQLSPYFPDECLTARGISSHTV